MNENNDKIAQPNTELSQALQHIDDKIDAKFDDLKRVD